jgi:acetylornithine deacetylase
MEEIAKKIDYWVDTHADEIIDLASRLVQIPSENKPPVGFELACQNYLRKVLNDAGARVDYFFPEEVPGFKESPLYLQGRTYKDRPNVVGTFPGTGGGKSLLLIGHIDTVPREPMPWIESSPFSGEVKNGKLYGRGAYDMKGGMVSMFYGIKCLRDLGVSLKGDVLVESDVDEEYGGSNGTLASRIRGYTADAAIVPEPTNMVVYPVHKGGRWWKINLKGTPGRSFSQEEIVNPIHQMAEIVQILRDFEKERNTRPDPDIHPLYRDNPNLLVHIWQVGCEGATFSPAPGIDEKEHLNVLTGAPSGCYLHVFVETYEGTSEEDLEKEFIGYILSRIEKNPLFKHSKPEFEKKIRYLEGSHIPMDHPLLKSIEKAYHSLSSRPFTVQGAPYQCDVYLLNRYYGIPTAILGPGGANAHAPDEYVLIQDLIDLTKIFARIIVDWCS